MGKQYIVQEMPHLVALSCVVFAGVLCCAGAVPTLRLLSSCYLTFLIIVELF